MNSFSENIYYANINDFIFPFAVELSDNKIAIGPPYGCFIENKTDITEDEEKIKKIIPLLDKKKIQLFKDGQDLSEDRFAINTFLFTPSSNLLLKYDNDWVVYKLPKVGKVLTWIHQYKNTLQSLIILHKQKGIIFGDGYSYNGYLLDIDSEFNLVTDNKFHILHIIKHLGKFVGKVEFSKSLFEDDLLRIFYLATWYDIFKWLPEESTFDKKILKDCYNQWYEDYIKKDKLNLIPPIDIIIKEFNKFYDQE